METGQFKIDWARYFDAIYCVHFAPQAAKVPRLAAELDRVGIRKSGICHLRITNETTFDRILFDHYRSMGHPIPDRGCVNLAMEIVSILNQAIHSKMNRILILENDVAFLRDLRQIDATLQTMPDEADCVQFDKFVAPKGEAQYRKQIEESVSERFFNPGNTTYYSGACFALSRQGMKYLRHALTTVCPLPPDSYFAPIQWKRWVAKKNLAIQLVYTGSISANLYGINSHHDGYRRAGVDYAEYNVPEGYGYGKAVNVEADGR